MMNWPWNKQESSIAVAEVVSAPEPVSVAEQKPHLAPQAKPLDEPAGIDLSAKEMVDYQEKLSAVGITACAEVIQAKLDNCLRDEGICVYDTAKVVAFLDKVLGEKWEWHGIRQRDADHLGGWTTDADDARQVEFSNYLYTGTIPLPVLLTIENIQKAVPEVFFYVSSLPNPNGDPFLLVDAQGIDGRIVERWDEPNFRER